MVLCGVRRGVLSNVAWYGAVRVHADVQAGRLMEHLRAVAQADQQTNFHFPFISLAIWTATSCR
eukprot:m.449872 g.449872  ORF g.449872 m.449872 type:complete len:64 (-) comp56905_c2_seq7:125-316(-)